MNTETMDALAGLAGPYVRRRAVGFVEAAAKLGIVGLEAGLDADRVFVTVPYEAAAAEYGGGVSGEPSAWVERAVMDLGGHLG